MLKLILFVAMTLFNFSDAYKILVVFPMPGKSHSILGAGYVRNLLEAGHEVTYITPVPLKNSSPRLRQIDVSENFKYLPSAKIFNVKSLMEQKVSLQDYMIISKLMVDFMNKTLHTDVLQKFMHDPNERFDAVVAEWLYHELGSGFAAVFNCPLIWSSSMVPHTFVLFLIDGHHNPAYVIDHLSKRYSFDFWMRLQNLWVLAKVSFNKWNYDTQEEIFEETFGKAIKARGRISPSFDEVRFNGSLMLGNSHITTGDAIALPHNYKDIGGYHIGDADPLPKDLQDVLDNSKNGVIYFSLGSMLQSTSMPESTLYGLIESFGQLNQTVVWKLEKPVSNLPKNVHIVTWAPQSSILAHPNCILFITHGGLLSTLEALHYGVPIIGMPFYADQYLNTDRAVHKGFGRRLVMNENTHKEIKAVIEDMVDSKSTYRRRAKELSAIYHDRLVPPGKEMVFWIEHVIRTQGAPHLKSVTLQLEWYSRLYLDLVALIVLVFIILLLLVVRLSKGSIYKKKVD